MKIRKVLRIDTTSVCPDSAVSPTNQASVMKGDTLAPEPSSLFGYSTGLQR